jgi:hypothetical protein
MGHAWIYGRRVVEWLLTFAIGHGIILYLATVEIFPDRFIASMITTAVEAPVWAHWIMAGLFGLLCTFLLEIFLWHSSLVLRLLGGRKNTTDQAVASDTALDAPKSAVSAPLGIELGTGANYECLEHFPENGLVRRSIKIAIVNRSADDVADCNVRLIAATPPAMIGDSKASYPILFTQNFDLAAGKRKYVKIISLIESGWQIEWQKHSITIHVAVGGGWVSRGWTTLSPLPTQGNPGVLTFEAFAPGVASSQAQVKIWVDETLGRKLCAGIG